MKGSQLCIRLCVVCSRSPAAGWGYTEANTGRSCAVRPGKTCLCELLNKDDSGRFWGVLEGWAVRFGEAILSPALEINLRTN